MKLVILGAGASFDSIHAFFDDKKNIVEWRPPLANELFSSRESFRNIFLSYPGTKALLSEITSISDIEDYFQNKWDFTQKYPHAKELASNIINIQYALQHLMFEISNKYRYEGASNYDILVQKAYEYSKATNEDVLFVTFNYDLFLEYSFRNIYANSTVNVLMMDEYISNSLKLFKPHGSCNWIKLFDPIFHHGERSIDQYIYEKGYTYNELEKKLISTVYAAKEFRKMFYEEHPPKHVFPQILIPLKSKDDFLLPKEHFIAMEEGLEKVTDVLIIGWKGQEQKFRDLLKNTFENKAINFTIVNPLSNENGRLTYMNDFKKDIPNGNFNFFDLDYQKKVNDNTILSYSLKEKQRAYSFIKGSFSSYILNVMNNKFQNFFSY